MALFSLPQRFNDSNCDRRAQRISEIQINSFVAFLNISRSVTDQRLRFDAIDVFDLLKTSNCSDHHVGSLN